jgi:hypothetical protein
VGLLFACATIIMAQLIVPGSRVVPWNLILAGCALLIFLLGIINFPVYVWFVKRRGLCFAMGAVWLHWLYYFYSGCAFIAGAMSYCTERVMTFERAPRMTEPE